MAITIGKRKIGDGAPCYIIAEAGSNHNGKMEIAKRLIDKAADAKADAIKFQIFKAETLYVGSAGHADYLKDSKEITEIIREMEFPPEWIAPLAEYCKKRGLDFLATPFDEEAAMLLEKVVPAYKIASYESNHLPFIKYVAKFGKPMIISTGASDMAQVREALDTTYSAGNRAVALMQCTAKYPAPLSAMNLKAIEGMKKEFGVPVGLSDHSAEPFVAPMASVALGASIIEKHFTLDRKMDGPDHKFAIEPPELARMVKLVRETEEALGSGKKEVLPEENELCLFAKRAVHAVKEIRKGEKFSRENIAALRPGKVSRGVEPKYFEGIIGKAAKRDISQWEGIMKGDF